MQIEYLVYSVKLNKYQYIMPHIFITSVNAVLSKQKLLVYVYSPVCIAVKIGEMCAFVMKSNQTWHTTILRYADSKKKRRQSRFA